MATRVRQGPYCSHKPLETAGCCKPRGQAMLDLLPADSKGSNKRSMQDRKQIWASKRHSLDLLLLCRKTEKLMVFFKKCKTRMRTKVWWIPECPPLSSHSIKTCSHQPTRKSKEEQSREKNQIHILLACPWGAGSVHCARQESQALLNKPIKQQSPASSTSSKAHTELRPPTGSSTGTWKRCPRSISGGEGSTALQMETRHSNTVFL